MSSRQRLSNAAHRFCDDFARKQSIDVLLTHFSDTRACEVLEHGLSKFAPFLGTPFRGRDRVRYYLSTLVKLIAYEDMHFSEYIVDDEVRKVSVKGTATFTWIATGDSWDETFTYALDFDEQNKITRYQVWGDTGALYFASQGRLREVRHLSRPRRSRCSTCGYRVCILITYSIQYNKTSMHEIWLGDEG